MVDGYSDFDGEVSTTTVLPAPQNPATTVNTTSITVSADSVTDADGYRFYRAQSSGSVLGDYTEVGDVSTPSFDDTGVEDGEQYYYRVTAYTTDTESDLSSEVTAVAFLPAPTVTLSENSPNGVLVSWTKEDNSTDGDWRIDRRSDGATAWTTIANPALGDREYTDTGVAAGEYEYRVARVTDHDPEATTTASITIGVANDPQGFVVGSGSNAVQFAPDELVAKDLEKIPTGIGTARVEVPETDSLISNVQRQDRADYYVDGECVFTGYAVGFAGNDRTGKWTVRVDGIGKRLEETRPDYDALGGSLTYENISLQEALRDYWPRTPFSASVTDEPESVVASDELVQSADSTTEWQNALGQSTSTDLWKIENGELTTKPINWVVEGENPDRSNTTATPADSSYSNGEAIEVLDFAEYDITIEHDIPAEHVGLRVRDETPGTQGETDWILNGTTVATVPNGSGSISLGWHDIDFWEGGGATYDSKGGSDLSAGDTVTFRLEGPAAATDYFVDVISIYDKREEPSLTFDNSVDANGYLSGPETKPESVTVTGDIVGTAFNISASNLASVWDDTSGSQAIAASNDGSGLFVTASNASSLDQSYSGDGRQAQVRFTLSRYGSRSTATPTSGFNGQAVDSFEHRVDFTDLTVIVELELSRNHFDNLKKLHNYGDYLWTIEHDDDSNLSDLVVNSYPRGEITRSTPAAFQDPENRSPEVAAETYFNSIYLQGRLRDDGTRPTADVSDSAAVSSDGREISPGVLRDPSIGTDAGAEFRANALLDTALNNNDLRGSITTYPEYVEPGFSYSIDFGNGPAEKTLERINIRESAGQIQATYQFVVKEQLAETLNALKQNSRDQSDQI
jgi:hypothetical protein